MRGSQTLPKSKQLLFVVEGKCSESELIHSAMKSIGVNTERYAVAAFHTNVHALIETIVVESDWRPDDFAAVEIREVLAEILENGGAVCKSCGATMRR